MRAKHPAYDTKIVVGGRSFSVRRSYKLAKSIEESFGPLQELSDRMLELNLRFLELYELYVIMVGDKITSEELEALILDVGTPRITEAAFPVVFNLFVGAENARSHEDIIGSLNKEKKKS